MGTDGHCRTFSVSLLLWNTTTAPCIVGIVYDYPSALAPLPLWRSRVPWRTSRWRRPADRAWTRAPAGCPAGGPTPGTRSRRTSPAWSWRCWIVGRPDRNETQYTYIVHMYMHACIHTYIHTYLPTYLPTYIHTYTHTYIHTYIHTYTHTYIHTNICMHAYMHIRTYICITNVSITIQVIGSIRLRLHWKFCTSISNRS